MAVNSDFNLLRSIRQRRLRYLGHILRLPPERLLRKALFAYVLGSDSVPEGSLIADYPEHLPLGDLVTISADRKRWADMVDNIV